MYYGGATFNTKNMNKIKNAIRSLNPVIRMVIILVIAMVAALGSGFFFGHYLGNNSPITFFVLILFATFVIVGFYVHFIEGPDE